MKNIWFKFVLLSTLFIWCSNSFGQNCTACGSDFGSLVPTTSWQTAAVNPGADDKPYFTFSATIGETYDFSFCDDDGSGGSSAGDHQFTIITACSGAVKDTDDDGCGSPTLSPTISWVADATGTFTLLITRYSGAHCQDLSGGVSYTLGYKKTAVPAAPATIFEDDFETDKGWTLTTNGSEWIRGTAEDNGGSNSLYVTNDGGSSASYDIGASKTLYAESPTIDLTSVTGAVLTFDWKCVGENIGANIYDYGEVYVDNGSDVLISSAEEYYNQSAWTGETISLAAFDGQSITIKFKWDNDGTSSDGIPFCIDNFDVTGSSTATAPDAPVFANTGGASQLAFNNANIFDNTPLFRASATHTGPFDRFQVEINTQSDFAGTAYTQIFSGAYSSATQYDLDCNALSTALPTTNDVTYYVRVKASEDAGSTYGDWSSGTYSFTYKSTGNADWYQTTTEQFATSALGAASASANNITLGGASIFTDDFESGIGNWTQTDLVLTDGDWAIYTGTRFPGGGGAHSGTDLCYFNSYSSTDGKETRLETTASLDFSSITNSTVKFWMYHDAGYSTKTDRIQVQYKIGAGSWVNSGTAVYRYDGTVQWTEHSIDISAVDGQATVYIGFHAISNYGNDCHIDDVTVSGDGAGTVTSTMIDYASFTGPTSWGNAEFTDDETGSDVKYKVYHDVASVATIIPDGALAGNSTGFDESPIDLSGLNAVTYDQLYLYTELTYTSQAPLINDWKITVNYGDQESDIVEAGFDEPDNIAYVSYQAANTLTTVNAIKVGSFTIRDGGADFADADGNSTTLSDITFTVLNPENIRALAIMDEGGVNRGEVTSISSSTAISGLTNIVCSDADANGYTFDLYATFNSTVDDNEQIQFTITNTSAEGSGSVFADVDAGGALTSIAGDDNRLEVTATQLGFQANYPPSSVANNNTFTVIVQAEDANGNLDVDNTCAVTLVRGATGTSSITANNTPTLTQSLVSGVFEWDNILYSTVETFNIDASCGGLSGTSIDIVCIAPPGAFSVLGPLSTGGCAGNVNITWGASSNAVSYDIYSCEGSNCDPEAGSVVSGVTSPYVFIGSSANTEYRFVVRANNAAGFTLSSNEGVYTTYQNTATISTWSGATNGDWSNAGNWCGSVPSTTISAIIPAGLGQYPTLDGTTNVLSVTVVSGGTIDGSSQTMNVIGDFVNNGTFIGNTGTLNFAGTNTQLLNGGSSGTYNDVTINKASGTITLSDNTLNIDGNLLITSGTLSANDQNMTVAGNWTNNATFIGGTGTVTFDGGGTSTINRVGASEVIFFDGFENGNQGWTMSSVDNHTEWRIQNGTPNTGTYDCALYDLNTSTGYSYCTTCSNFSIDLFRTIDLTDYSSASLSFYCEGPTVTLGDDPRGTILIDGVQQGIDIVHSIGYTQTTRNLDAFCGDGEHQLALRFYEAGANDAADFSIDDVQVSATSTTQIFNNMEVNKSGGTVQMNSVLVSNGNIIITDGTLNANGNLIKSYGDFTNNGTYIHGNGEIQFLGSSAQNIDGSSNSVFYDVLKNSTGSLIIGDASTSLTIEADNSFNWVNNADNIIVGNGAVATFIVNDDFYIKQTCSMETDGSSIISIEGNYSDHGTYTPNTGTVMFHGARDATIIREPASVIYSEGFESGAATGWTLGDEAGQTNWQVQSGSGSLSDFDLAIYDVYYDMTHDYNWGVGTGTPAVLDAYIDIDLTGYQNASLKFDYRIGGDVNDFGEVIIKVGATEYPMSINGSTTIVSEPGWTSSGTIDITAYSNQTIRLIYRFDYDNANAGVAPGFCIDNVLVSSTSVEEETFYNIYVDKTASKSTALWCPVDVDGTVTINQGDLNSGGYSFPVAGDWTVNGASTFTHLGNSVTFDGIATQTIINGASTSFNNVVVNKTGSANLSTNTFKLDNNLTLTGGTLNVGSVDTEIKGTWLNNGGTFNGQSRLVTFNGTGDQNITSNSAALNTFYSITMEKASGIIIPVDSITMDGTMSLVDGIFDVATNNTNIRLKGDWLVGDGTTLGSFFAGTGTVSFFGATQNVNKTTGGAFNANNFTFNDIVIDGTDVNFFLESSTYTITVRDLHIVSGKVIKVDGQE